MPLKRAKELKTEKINYNYLSLFSCDRKVTKIGPVNLLPIHNTNKLTIVTHKQQDTERGRMGDQKNALSKNNGAPYQ